MTTEGAVAAVIDALNRLGMPHMLVGSLATNFYGIPRFSQDADFVLALGGTPIRNLADELGPEFELDPQMSFETATGTIRHQFKLKPIDFLIELFHLSEDEHDQVRFFRRREVQILGRTTFVPRVEDVIITKLRWSLHGRRAKDIDDVRNVVGVQGERIDWAYVETWCQLHGTLPLLSQVRPEPGSKGLAP